MSNRHAFVLAGGLGTRMRPHTAVLPKPLIPLGDQAIIERVLRAVGAAGIPSATVSLGYLGHLIQAVVGDGAKYGLSVTYTTEDEPLGTAGALSLIPVDLNDDDVVLVINGDTLTSLDLDSLLTWFEGAGAGAAMVCVERDITIDYGVVHADAEGHLMGIDEKPQIHHTLSTGINVLRGKHVRELRNEPLDMPDLLVGLSQRGVPVLCHTVQDLWMDLGRPEDLAAAQELVGQGIV